MTVRDRLRTALTAAMKSRDTTATAALRSALAAIDNAEAVEAAPGSPMLDGPIPGAVAGLGAAEVPRRALTESEMLRVVEAEIAERESAARSYEDLGQHDDADRLRSEAVVLRRAVEGAYQA